MTTAANEHPVRAIANVTSWSECLAAIRHGYAAIICGSQGFCPPHGTWMHC